MAVTYLCSPSTSSIFLDQVHLLTLLCNFMCSYGYYITEEKIKIINKENNRQQRKRRSVYRTSKTLEQSIFSNTAYILIIVFII